VAIPFRSPPPPGLPPPDSRSQAYDRGGSQGAQNQSTSTRGYPLAPPTEAFSTLSVDPSTLGTYERVPQSEVSHPRGIEAVERRLNQLKPSPFAIRPGHGVQGKALTVKTNYFQVRPWNGETPKIIQ